MKFLADMGISPKTMSFLRRLEHDASHLHDQGLDRLEDPDILIKARIEGRILLTQELLRLLVTPPRLKPAKSHSTQIATLTLKGPSFISSQIKYSFLIARLTSRAIGIRRNLDQVQVGAKVEV